ncbi:hypothetical protein TWF481_008027 [Arthrobotrys musiformis]|uniref:F-box domain-containing protein n=1 Tax=Arthrobotrys musiformis TaxID=47236 RepID=A0AAV9W5X1_9PEZI
MSPKATLSTIPSDIVHEICDYLCDQDFIKLQLVSAALCSKLPRSRLDEVHSRRTVRFTDAETRKLKRLVSGRPDKLGRIKHLVFNISSPYVKLLLKGVLMDWINSYSWSTRVKMVKFWSNYQKKNRRNPFKHEAFPQFHPGSEDLLPGQSLRREHFLGLFSILESAMQPPPKFDPKAFFKVLTEVLKLLPNLQILEFAEDSLRLRDEREFSLFLGYNPSLKEFVSKNPELEELPWREWLITTGNPIRFDAAYLTVLFCAAVAGCRGITEIKADRMRFLSHHETGVSLSRFSTYGTNTVSIPLYIRKEERYEAAYLDYYLRAFENLRRLEIWGWGVETAATIRISPLFLATIKNVRELRLRLPLGNGSSRFVDLPDIHLPNMRRLEIVSTRVDLTALQEFAAANEGSLRELVMQGRCSENMNKSAIIEFLENMRGAIDLQTYQMGFVTYSDGICFEYFLLVDVRGGWRGAECEYRVKLRCERWMRMSEPKEEEEWEVYRSWEGFIRGIRNASAPPDICPYHQW